MSVMVLVIIFFKEYVVVLAGFLVGSMLGFEDGSYTMFCAQIYVV